MAQITINDISAITTQKIVPEIYDVYYKVSPVFYMLFRGGNGYNVDVWDGGTQIQQPIQYAPTKGGSFAPGATFDISYVETDTAMTFNGKYYYQGVTIRGPQLVLNRGPHAVMDLVESKLVNVSQGLAANLATDIYLDGQGTNSPITSLDGFQAAYDDGTNYANYGQITRATIGSGANTGINGYYLNVGGPLSLSTLQKATGQATFGLNQPSLYSTTQSIYNQIWNKLQVAQRVNDNFGEDGPQNIGYQAFRFNNHRVVVDQYCPSGSLYLINTNFVKVFVSSSEKYNFGFTGFKEMPQTDDVTGQLLFAGNIVVTSPRFGGILTGITG